MPNTFSQIYLQFVFAVQHRRSLIPGLHKEEVHKYITALVQNRNSKMLAVHCMPDHIHIFAGLKPTVFIPDFVKEIKVKSNEFIRARPWGITHFNWQEGYGVFSYGHSQIDRVCQYIFNQEAHHQKQSFQKEYIGFLDHYDIAYEDRYLFEWI